MLNQLDIAVSRLRDAWRLPPPGTARPAWARLADPWRLPARAPDHAADREYRRQLAGQMCEPCAWRWFAGREIRHWMCAQQLRDAIEAQYRRRHSDVA